jgi:hypothetical protein
MNIAAEQRREREREREREQKGIQINFDALIINFDRRFLVCLTKPSLLAFFAAFACAFALDNGNVCFLL